MTGPVGLVAVSHSRALADAAVALARQMAPGEQPIEVAAGTDDGGFGTDATAIAAAVAAADRGAGVVVVMDLGSAVLSAELALELLEDPDLAERVLLCPAPFVEGLVVAAVSAAGGASRAEVAAEAVGALAGKTGQLGAPEPEPVPAGDDAPAERGEFVVTDPHGLHARPASRLVAVVRGFDGARVRLRNATTGSGWVPAGSLSRVSTLGALRGHRVEVGADGPGAAEAVRAVLELHPAPASSSGSPPEGGGRTGAELDPGGPGATDDEGSTGAEPDRGGADGVERGAGRAHVGPGGDGPDGDGPDGIRRRGVGPGDDGPGGVESAGYGLADSGSGGVGPGGGGPRGPAARSGGSGRGATTAASSAATPPRASERPQPMSGGVAVGPAHLVDARVDVPDEPSRGPEAEHARLAAALDAARVGITATRDAATGDGAAILDAHLMLLDDPDLGDPARAAVDAGTAAPRAWADAVAAVAATLAALPDPYQAARAADVEAVGGQVLRALVGAPAPAPAPPGSVLVAPDLDPAGALALDPAVAGVVLAGGAVTAHGSILLRARGIPGVCGAGEGVLDLVPGTTLALDGGTGELVADPPPDVVDAFRARAADAAATAARATARAGEPAVTRDGATVLVGANAGSAADAATAVEHGADLVGLLRTEFLFLGRDAAPDVDEQTAAYRAVAEAAGGRRITLRTLDAGGDKPLPYLRLPVEANPFLGLRGIRLADRYPGLLEDQLLAAVRVAHETPVSLMLPMVSVLDELLAARRALDAAVAREGRGTPAGLQVGIMVEVPAAALAADAFAPHVDFFSIGTNDLVQYALAAERGNPAVAHLADPLHPGVLALVGAVCRAAGERVLVAVCGEAAADPRAADRFVALGVRELSVAPLLVPATKEAVRAMGATAG